MRGDGLAGLEVHLAPFAIKFVAATPRPNVNHIRWRCLDRDGWFRPFWLDAGRCRKICRYCPQVRSSFENIDSEFAIEEICNSHDVSLELRLYCPEMSRAQNNATQPAGKTRLHGLLKIRVAPSDVWEVFVHAFWADAMAEIQCAVLHQEPFDRLPEPFAVADRLAVAAGGDQSFMVMHLTELIHEG